MCEEVDGWVALTRGSSRSTPFDRLVQLYAECCVRARLAATVPAMTTNTNGSPSPHRSTVLRRAAKAKRVFPVISRSGRTFYEANGRSYGETAPHLQKQADAGYWIVGEAVRRDLEPMTVAVDGVVRRIYEVLDWKQDPSSGKWVADLGRLLTDADLNQSWPNYPYRSGDHCPTMRGRAYRPESY